ncbi:MAG: DUF1501 domain-containing protein [Planctomycetes bacterium]|nr:DUF1501 domain-containing protein [Planctomycetota bacterium]
MPTNRRVFLKQLGAAGIVSLGARPPAYLSQAAWAAEAEGGQPRNDRVLVLVQMAGGNDGLNTVIPHGDPEYYKARPGINIGTSAVLRIDDYLGFHPQMTGFKELYDEGHLAIVQGVGYPNPDRSHFRSMDIWHSARPDSDYTKDGWLGRGLDQTVAGLVGGLRALALGTNRLPLALLSAKVNVPSVSDLSGYRLELGSGPEANHPLQRRLLSEIADRQQTGAATDSGSANLDFLRKTALTAFSSADKLKEVTASYQPSATYPSNGLGQKLKVVAQIIAGDLGTRVVFVSLDGFDTHSQQAPAHQGLLSELSSAIRAFFADLKGHNLDQRVVLATFSEFGRRVQENGSLGTDHGAGSQLFVVGPTVHGGVHGKHPSLTDLVDGDLKFHTDFRAVYATLLTKVLGWPADTVLGGKFPVLDFV